MALDSGISKGFKLMQKETDEQARNPSDIDTEATSQREYEREGTR